MTFDKEKFREIVFQILFTKTSGQGADEEIVKLLAAELKITRKQVWDAIRRAEEIQKRLPELDQKISELGGGRKADDISPIERTILRLGLFEALFDDEIPPQVAIAEAIRLTKKFGIPEASSLVNAILDKAFKSNDLH